MKVHGNRWLGLIDFKIRKKSLKMNDKAEIKYFL